MIRSIIGALFLVAAAPTPAAELPPIYTTGDATVCFASGNNSTIGGDCAAVLVAEIAKTGHVLLVQAYNFTEPRIIAAIIEAHRRGVLVTVILDKISPSQKGEGADPVHDAGIPTFIDRKPKIAHNKVVVIDQATVVTGSFNFSTNAGCCKSCIGRNSPSPARRTSLSGGRSASSIRKRSRAQAARDRNRLGSGTAP